MGAEQGEHAPSLRGKFSRDVLWGMGGFGVMAASGVALNVLIGHFHGPGALGAFNQVFAVYILVSQLATFGLHYSTLTHVAAHAGETPARDAIITSALALVAATATVTSLLGLLAADLIGRAFDSPAVAEGWRWALPGLWCFALNKVLLAALNALRHMRAFAVGQAARSLLLILALGACSGPGTSGSRVPIVLSVAEGLLLVGLLAHILGSWRPSGPSTWGQWLRAHLSFGGRSFASGTLVEANSRVDVVVLGLFVGDALVGVYSLASMLAEGFAQLPVVLRSNVNPLITRHVTDRRLDLVSDLARRIVPRLTLAMVAGAGVAMGAYPLAVRAVGLEASFGPSWVPFVFLTAGVALSAGYVPFNMLLVQAGRPGQHTLLTLAVVVTSVTLNCALIPAHGVAGAAAATALTAIAATFYLLVAARWSLGLRLWPGGAKV